jgi:hypothetical protein
MIKSGFRYDKKRDAYFYHCEPASELEKKIEKAKKQGAIPASTVEEFKEREAEWVEKKMADLKNKSSKRGQDDESERKSKKMKKEEEEEEEEEDE